MRHEGPYEGSWTHLFMCRFLGVVSTCWHIFHTSSCGWSLCCHYIQSLLWSIEVGKCNSCGERCVQSVILLLFLLVLELLLILLLVLQRLFSILWHSGVRSYVSYAILRKGSNSNFIPKGKHEKAVEIQNTYSTAATTQALADHRLASPPQSTVHDKVFGKRKNGGCCLITKLVVFATPNLQSLARRICNEILMHNALGRWWPLRDCTPSHQEKA